MGAYIQIPTVQEIASIINLWNGKNTSIAREIVGPIRQLESTYDTSQLEIWSHGEKITDYWDIIWLVRLIKLWTKYIIRIIVRIMNHSAIYFNYLNT